MTTTLATPGTDAVIASLRDAVRLRDSVAVTHRIQSLLEEALGQGRLELPDRFRETVDGHYARRLLHRDEELDWTAVVMTWSPGQRTPLHDHDGSWCVEGVIDGTIEVTMYDHLGREGEFHRFRRKHTQYADPGEAGALIPPYEHHVLGNASQDRTALTLHVYEGKMARCSTFEPVEPAELAVAEGSTRLYRREQKILGYDE